MLYWELENFQANSTVNIRGIVWYNVRNKSHCKAGTITFILDMSIRLSEEYDAGRSQEF